MNRYCLDLNFNNSSPFRYQSMIDNLLLERKRHTILDSNFFSTQIVSIFDELGLYIWQSESFYKPAGDQLATIHTDSDSIYDHIKINWVICQDPQSRMHWYSINNNQIHSSKLRITPAGSPHRQFFNDDVTLEYSARVGFPSMVQTGVPHYVIAGLNERLCISVVPYGKVTKRPVTWDEGLCAFKKYIT